MSQPQRQSIGNAKLFRAKLKMSTKLSPKQLGLPNRDSVSDDSSFHSSMVLGKKRPSILSILF